MSTVALVGCATYEDHDLLPALERALELCGGLADVVRPGDRVLLKPNLLAGRPPQRQVTTHPAVVGMVARMVLNLGARPVIGDSPGLDTFKRAADKSGMAEVARELGCALEGLADPRPAPVREGVVFKNLELARLALEADVIINLPKLKTHGQMLLTLGVKNLFGTVVAERKAEWHMVAGMERRLFASLLLDIHTALRPGLTILDGIWGMEGHGPQNGEPKHLGLIAASRDALALDLALCDLLGVERRRFPLAAAAAERGLVPKEITLVGDDPASLAPESFATPELGSMDFLPAYTPAWIRRRVLSKPVHEEARCARCGECVKICPAQAMKLRDRGMTFDYEACIRCYCCQEICAYDAISFKKGLLQKAIGLVGR